MKKFISLMNEQSFYYLWHNENTKKYLERVIASIIGEEDNYVLLDTFNDECDNLRSYIFLESFKRVIYISLNNKLDTHDLMDFLYLTYKIPITFIIFKLIKSKNITINDTYYINKNKINANEVKLLLSTSYKEQKKYDCYGVTDYLYNLDDEFYQKYLKEELKK